MCEVQEARWALGGGAGRHTLCTVDPAVEHPSTGCTRRLSQDHLRLALGALQQRVPPACGGGGV